MILLTKSPTFWVHFRSHIKTLELAIDSDFNSDTKNYYLNFYSNANLAIKINDDTLKPIKDTVFTVEYYKDGDRHPRANDSSIFKIFTFNISIDTVLKYKSDIKLVLKSKIDTVDKEIEYYPNF